MRSVIDSVRQMDLETVRKRLKEIDLGKLRGLRKDSKRQRETHLAKLKEKRREIEMRNENLLRQ